MGLEEILKEFGADMPFDENGDLTPNGADAWEKLINVLSNTLESMGNREGRKNVVLSSM